MVYNLFPFVRNFHKSANVSIFVNVSEGNIITTSLSPFGGYSDKELSVLLLAILPLIFAYLGR